MEKNYPENQKPLFHVGEEVIASGKVKKITAVWFAGHKKCWAYDLEKSPLWYYEHQLKKKGGEGENK